MKSKTCGECRFLSTEYDRLGRGQCYYTDNWYLPSCGACKAFQEAYHADPLTNGDRIRQMDDADLADFLIGAAEDIATNKPSREEILSWLNAPAESEVNNG